jgi:hypothetical protein
MAAVGMMQVAVHKIIDVIAVRNGLVTTAGAVLVVLAMTAAAVARRATGRVLASHSQAVLLNPLGSHVVQVAVVQVVDVPLMFDGGVAAGRAMLMIVFGMNSSHSETSFSGTGSRLAEQIANASLILFRGTSRTRPLSSSLSSGALKRFSRNRDEIC